MSYTAPLSQQDIDKGQRRFYYFLASLIIVLAALITSFQVNPTFWNGHILWSAGSYCVGASIIHTKYFDVMKISNPSNLQLSNHKRNSFVTLAEEIIKVLWILGFILVAVSRWVVY